MNFTQKSVYHPDNTASFLEAVRLEPGPDGRLQVVAVQEHLHRMCDSLAAAGMQSPDQFAQEILRRALQMVPAAGSALSTDIPAPEPTSDSTSAPVSAQTASPTSPPTSVPTSAGRIFKLRFEYDRSGLTSAQAIPYQPRRITRLAIRPLPQDVPLHQLYPLKYRSRSLLDAAGSGLQATEGVVLRYNTWITDAGHASLAFRQGNTWFTPDTPLLPGTTRTRLLREGKLSARRITTTCLQQFSEVCIFNAMLAFGEQRLPISALYYDDDWSYQDD